LLLDEQTGLNYMLNAFQLGKREHFFVSWNRFVPLALRQNDLICQKLEFYIRIYFAIFPVHPINPQAPSEKELKKELLAFRHFLDTNGAELSKTGEFLSFYALPYVANPVEHPTFRSLFSKKWAADLKQKLKQFLQANLPKLSSPALFHWYSHFKKQKGSPSKEAPEAEELKERLLLMQKHYVIL